MVSVHSAHHEHVQFGKRGDNVVNELCEKHMWWRSLTMNVLLVNYSHTLLGDLCACFLMVVLQAYKQRICEVPKRGEMTL